MKRAGILMEQGRYRDAHNGYASLLQRYRKVADVDLVRLRMGVSQYRRRQLTVSVANFKRVTSDELAPEALYYQAQVARRLRRPKTQLARVTELERRFPHSKWTAAALVRLADHYEENDEIDEALTRFNQVIKQFPQGEHTLDARWRVHWHAYRRGRFEEAGRVFSTGLDVLTRKPESSNVRTRCTARSCSATRIPTMAGGRLSISLK